MGVVNRQESLDSLDLVRSRSLWGSVNKLFHSFICTALIMSIGLILTQDLFLAAEMQMPNINSP